MLDTIGPLHSQWLNGSLIIYPQSMLGTEYCVDGNAGSDTNSGLDWNNAFKTIAAAIAAADDDIAVTNHWDRRNRIYVNGGAYTTDLVRFPEKTDIIGVGCTDFRAKAQIIGHAIPATAVNGCRWINMSFECLTAHPCVTLGASNHGAAFINCDFEGNASTTYGLDIAACVEIHVEGCRFYGYDGGRRFTAGIRMATNPCYNARIVDNYFYTGIGITITAGAGATGTIISGNEFDVTTLAIADNTDQASVINNRWISAAAKGSTYTLSTARCIGNLETGNNGSAAVPVIPAT